jgi:vacuolar iron transporter family protein
VLGADDGVVSTSSLMLGVAASSAADSAVLVAGIAGLVAGALSMAAGDAYRTFGDASRINYCIAMQARVEWP